MAKSEFSHVRHAYSGPIRCDLLCEDHTLTQQQFRDECDVNYIMRTYDKTGILTHVNTRSPLSGDFTSVVDYQSACNAVIEAEAAFMALDPHLRARFSNDPGELLAFVSDEANYDEALRLGLVDPKPVLSDSVSVQSTDSAVVEKPPV